ncbi:DUF397 domain-containing protein [Streptomyces sp. 3MP-14]|uniref:DUF397 domain-containing protein n=1 Tax=Streptomyces mimosae TaxID=2586635 RepID=A0A5N6ACV8_9ACTN|nr:MULTISPECIES: DUF397 domain-containing protein [Streptomyces]KAB8165786.1 DUF397 domain-containing protein [Streptomyces mimosae]KAB8176175.1 DUF397 domain-containing protein [Streptomyces sp. 3MP-14]
MKSIPDASALTGWRKSSYSNGDGGDCLEIIDGLPADIPVRDSKHAEGPALFIPRNEWTAFVRAVRNRDLSA